MNSEMAVPSFPTEHPNIWSSKVKNLHIQNVNCSCSFKGDIFPSCDTLWRFRSRSYHLVPKRGKQHKKLVVTGSYMRIHGNSSPAYWLHSSMAGAYRFRQPRILPSTIDTDKIQKCTKSNYSRSTEVSGDPTALFPTEDAFLGGFKCSDVDNAFPERNQPIEEPWLLHSSLFSQYAARPNDSGSLQTQLLDQSVIKVQNYSENEERTLQHVDSISPEIKLSNHSLLKFEPFSKSEDISRMAGRGYDIFKTFSLRNQPVEEPWLLESSLPQESDEFHEKVLSNDNFVKVDATNPESADQELSINLHQVSEKLLAEEESISNSSRESVPMVILINSSVCTMQRIAVLEDEKLVELLLEPVKNNVLCDSVYLGAVTKLVPHMGGAFVNIGSSRPSLMDIKNNREPFIFPPFRHLKEKEVNGFASTGPGEQSGANGMEISSEDVDVTNEIEDDEIDDDSEEYLHDKFGEPDIEDDDVIIEAFKENLNGSLTGFGEVEVNSNGFSDQLKIDGTPPSHLRVVGRDSEDAHANKNWWSQVRKGTKVVVQVVKEGLGTKGPTLTAYPKLRSRFWVLSTRCDTIGISKKITGVERTRLRVIAKTLQPQGFGLTVRTVAAGRSLDELRKDLEGLLSTWKDIMGHAKSAALAADEGVEGALPVILHRAMGQTLTVAQDYFNEKVNSMVVDSARTYHEVTNYLQEIAPQLCDRVELYSNKTPLFDEYHIEEEIDNMLSKWVSLANGGYLVIEQTEALVSIDVNGGQCMLGQGTSQEEAILDVNLAAAKQIAREIRLRDIGGIIVVDFIDMIDDANKRLVYEEVKKAVERDRSTVKVSELSKNGLMEITRKRVRPSVTFMISEPCTCCHSTGRVEALETSFSKIEHEICRLLATMDKKAEPEDPKSWPRFILRVDRFMCNYLTSGKRTRLAVLSSSLKVWILLKVVRNFNRGAFEVKPLTGEKDDNDQKQVAINMLRPTEIGSYAPSGKVTVFPVKKWKSGRK